MSNYIKRTEERVSSYFKPNNMEVKNKPLS